MASLTTEKKRTRASCFSGSRSRKKRKEEKEENKESKQARASKQPELVPLIFAATKRMDALKGIGGKEENQ